MVCFKNFDYSKLDVINLLEIKKTLANEIIKTEERKCEDACLWPMFRSWYEDDELIYRHNIEELGKLLNEILIRMDKHEWLFMEENW